MNGRNWERKRLHSFISGKFSIQCSTFQESFKAQVRPENFVIATDKLRFKKAFFCALQGSVLFQVLFKKGVPLLMPNRSGARGIHTAAAKG